MEAHLCTPNSPALPLSVPRQSTCMASGHAYTSATSSPSYLSSPFTLVTAVLWHANTQHRPELINEHSPVTVKASLDAILSPSLDFFQSSVTTGNAQPDPVKPDPNWPFLTTAVGHFMQLLRKRQTAPTHVAFSSVQ